MANQPWQDDGWTAAAAKSHCWQTVLKLRTFSPLCLPLQGPAACPHALLSTTRSYRGPSRQDLRGCWLKVSASAGLFFALWRWLLLSTCTVIMQHLKVVTLYLLNVCSQAALLFYQVQWVIFLGEEMMWEMRGGFSLLLIMKDYSISTLKKWKKYTKTLKESYLDNHCRATPKRAWWFLVFCWCLFGCFFNHPSYFSMYFNFCAGFWGSPCRRPTSPFPQILYSI